MRRLRRAVRCGPVVVNDADAIVGRSAPQGRDRGGEEPIAQPVCTRTRVQHDPGDERVRIPVPKRGKVARAGAGRGRIGFDLDPDETTASQLGKEVDLEPALLLAHVVEARARCCARQLRAELRGDERVEQPSKQVSIAQDEIDIEAEHSAGETRIDHVPGCHSPAGPATALPHLPAWLLTDAVGVDGAGDRLRRSGRADTNRR